MPRGACLAAALAALAGCAAVTPRPEVAAPAEVAIAAPSGADGPATASEQGPRKGALDAAAAPAADERTSPDRPEEAPSPELRRRLVARARTFLGSRGPFHAAGERFTPDCSGFVAAVYAAEGIDLRGAMQRAAPRERGGAKAAWLAAVAAGVSFGASERPEPGDLVYWHDTYDRNRNHKADDRFTHVGIVEQVADGTVHFIHRGHRGVARGVMTLARPHEARDEDGTPLNSALRVGSRPVKRGRLAAELFAGYSRPGAAEARGPSVAKAGPSPRRSAPRRGRHAPVER